MGDREPQPRFWHSAVSCGGKIYVRGGSTPKFDTDEGRRELVTTIEEYDPIRRIWRQLTTTGELHPGLSAVACVTAGDHLYAYGGFDGRDVCGVLSQLNLKTLIWTRLSSQTAGGPMNKDASGMAHYNGDRLALIGGYADPNGPIQPGSTFVLNETINYGSGWTNEFHVFDIKAGSWSSPEIKGTRPPPCADFTLTSIDIHRAVLYGGCRPPEGKRLDKDLYLIHFSTMEITRIEWKPGEVWPVVTVGHHAACCLGFNTDHPQLLVSGGRSSQDKAVRGTWLFDFARKRWKEVKVQSPQKPRWGHTAAVMSVSCTKVEAIFFGGTPANYEYGWTRLRTEDFPRLTETEVINFEYRASEKTWTSCSTNGKMLGEKYVPTVIHLREEDASLNRHSAVVKKESHQLKQLMIIVLIIGFILLFSYVLFPYIHVPVY